MGTIISEIERMINSNDIEMASKLFLRYMESHMLGHTGYDTPKQETIHEIVKGYIQTQKLVGGVEFLEKIDSYRSETESSSPSPSSSTTTTQKKKGSYKTPIRPSMECYQKLEEALLQSTNSPTASGSMDKHPQSLTQQ